MRQSKTPLFSVSFVCNKPDRDGYMQISGKPKLLLKNMGRLRTKDSEKNYKKFLSEGILDGGCRLCEKSPIKDFGHWRIVSNDFPYDRIAEIHHMIISKRHVQEFDLSKEEKEEYQMDYVDKEYEFILEATLKGKIIPEHFHLHLMVAKD